MALYLHILCACARVTYLRNSYFFPLITVWRKKEMMKQHDCFFNCLVLENLRKINKRYAGGNIHTHSPILKNEKGFCDAV